MDGWVNWIQLVQSPTMPPPPPIAMPPPPMGIPPPPPIRPKGIIPIGIIPPPGPGCSAAGCI
jgi:hypothetical protein